MIDDEDGDITMHNYHDGWLPQDKITATITKPGNLGRLLFHLDMLHVYIAFYLDKGSFVHSIHLHTTFTYCKVHYDPMKVLFTGIPSKM